MTEPQNTATFDAFLAATIKAAAENPTLFAAFHTSEHAAHDVCEMLAQHTAGGDGSLLVFVAGREFAGKVLECLPSADEYPVTALVRDAILFCFSTRDNKGSLRCANFYTLAHVESMLQLGIPVELETEPA